MVAGDLRSLRDLADDVGMDRVRVFRLARVLRLFPGDPCVPSEVVDRIRDEPDDDARFGLIRTWLLENFVRKRDGTSPPTTR